MDGHLGGRSGEEDAQHRAGRGWGYVLGAISVVAALVIADNMRWALAYREASGEGNALGLMAAGVPLWMLLCLASVRAMRPSPVSPRASRGVAGTAIVFALVGLGTLGLMRYGISS